MPFSSLGLSHGMVQGVKAMGYVEPTPIQLRAIPLILAGQDVIGSAQTGTGKTAAFALPDPLPTRPARTSTRVLILEPTRELAAQVETADSRLRAIHRLARGGGLWRCRLRAPDDALRTGIDVLVATPGRLLDHIGQGTCRLDKVQYLVLDEADRMLDMGFLPDVRRIVDKMPTRPAHLPVFGHRAAANRNAHPLGHEEP